MEKAEKCFIDPAIVASLARVTPEENAILEHRNGVSREIYTNENDFIIDSGKLLESSRLIEIRPATRFVHFPEHRHNYVELVYMVSGSTTHIVNEREKITLTAGDLLFLNQKATHEILPAGIGDISVNFIIRPAFFDRPLRMMDRNRTVIRDFLLSVMTGEDASVSFLHFRADDSLPVQNLVENMIWSLLHKDRTTEINTITQTTMGLLLMHLSGQTSDLSVGSPDSYEKQLTFRVLSYIEGNYVNGSLTEIAEKLHEPPYAVSRLLKKNLGQSFSDLIIKRRLQQAAYLLKNTSLPAEKIVTAVGYDNSSYFFRKFRDQYGVTPRQYRLSETIEQTEEV